MFSSTLQRASWLLPIVDSGIDEAEEVEQQMWSTFVSFFLSTSFGRIINLLQVDYFHGMCCANLRNVIWRLFEDPNSSKAARVKLYQNIFGWMFLEKFYVVRGRF